MIVLALDVGGTHTRIAEVEYKGRPKLLRTKEYLTSEVKDLSVVINRFKSSAERGCIGFAGPILGHSARLTNADLKVNTNNIKINTGLKKIFLINDFHAASHALPYLTQKDLMVLNKGSKMNSRVKMIAGPGTGLGKAYFIEGHSFPTEGGFTSVGIEDIEDYALFDYLKEKYSGQVYYEDILSGRGLIDIYDHLEIKTNLDVNMKIRKLIKKEPVYKAKIITRYSKQDKLSDMTLRIFTDFYARFVRDSVLNLICSDVYLIGGISEAIKDYLKQFFVKEFLRHRKYGSLLRKVHVAVVVREDIGLLGAGAYAAKK